MTSGMSSGGMPVSTVQKGLAGEAPPVVLDCVDAARPDEAVDQAVRDALDGRALGLHDLRRHEPVDQAPQRRERGLDLLRRPAVGLPRVEAVRAAQGARLAETADVVEATSQ